MRGQLAERTSDRQCPEGKDRGAARRCETILKSGTSSVQADGLPDEFAGVSTKESTPAGQLKRCGESLMHLLQRLKHSRCSWGRCVRECCHT